MERGNILRINLQVGQVCKIDIVSGDEVLQKDLTVRVLEPPKGRRVVRIQLPGDQIYDLPRTPVEETGKVGMIRFHTPATGTNGRH